MRMPMFTCKSVGGLEAFGMEASNNPKCRTSPQSAHRNDKHGRCHKGPDGSIRQRQPATETQRERGRERHRDTGRERRWRLDVNVKRHAFFKIRVNTGGFIHRRCHSCAMPLSFGAAQVNLTCPLRRSCAELMSQTPRKSAAESLEMITQAHEPINYKPKESHELFHSKTRSGLEKKVQLYENVSFPVHNPLGLMINAIFMVISPQTNTTWQKTAFCGAFKGTSSSFSLISHSIISINILNQNSSFNPPPSFCHPFALIKRSSKQPKDYIQAVQ